MALIGAESLVVPVSRIRPITKVHGEAFRLFLYDAFPHDTVCFIHVNGIQLE